MGTIGLHLLDLVETIRCSDENPNNEACFNSAVKAVAAKVKRHNDLLARHAKSGSASDDNAGNGDAGEGAEEDVTKGAAKGARGKGGGGSGGGGSGGSGGGGAGGRSGKAGGTSSEKAGHIKMPVTTYTPSNASDVVSMGELRGADVVVVDPPRKGLDEEVLAGLAEEEFGGSGGGGSIGGGGGSGSFAQRLPRRLVYVSCGFKAFQRDQARLTGPGGGGWSLIHAEGHILFPGADHIETVAIFDR